MRLTLFGGAAAIACAASFAACSDQQSAPTSSAGSARGLLADGARFRINGSGTATIHGDRGVTTVRLPSWSAAGTVRDGVARDETGTSPFGVLGLVGAHRGLLGAKGGNHAALFIDNAGTRHTVVWVFEPDGGPMRAVGHFVEGRLLSATEYRWSPAGNGWMLASVTRRSFRDGKLRLEVRGNTTGAAEIADRGSAERTLALLASAAVRLIGPAEAEAQSHSPRCQKEYLDFVAATAALVAADIAVEEQPLNPALWSLWLAASIKATQAEMALWLCELNHPVTPPIGAGPPFFEPLGCKYFPYLQGCDDDPMFTR